MPKINPKKEFKEFIPLFKKHLAEFVTGAFAFVTALLWRDAIQAFLNYYKQMIESMTPFQNIIVSKFLVAFFVTVFSVAAIAIITKVLKEQS